MATVYTIEEKLAHLDVIVGRLRAVHSQLAAAKRERDVLLKQKTHPTTISTAINSRLTDIEAEADQIATDLGNIRFDVYEEIIKIGCPYNFTQVHMEPGTPPTNTISANSGGPFAPLAIGDLVEVTSAEDPTNKKVYGVAGLDVDNNILDVSGTTIPVENEVDTEFALRLIYRT